MGLFAGGDGEMGFVSLIGWIRWAGRDWTALTWVWVDLDG